MQLTLVEVMCLLSVQDGQERDAFFKRLPAQLPTIPVPVAQRKLLPMISQALEFGGAPAMALGAHLFSLALSPKGFPTVVAITGAWSAGFGSGRSIAKAKTESHRHHLAAA
jgi:hypothetical protein